MQIVFLYTIYMRGGKVNVVRVLNLARHSQYVNNACRLLYFDGPILKAILLESLGKPVVLEI